MLVELIDHLRCPNDHEEAWLVAVSARPARGRLTEGTLGCPVCDATFPVRGGDVFMGDGIASEPMPAGEHDAMRAAALLRLEEHGRYLLDGGWGSLASALRELLDVDLLLADPPTDHPESAAGQNVLRGVGDRWPLAVASMHGVALDRTSPGRLADAVRILKPGGRLVAPAAAPLPAGVAELARDERHWVAEKIADVIKLSRIRR